MSKVIAKILKYMTKWYLKKNSPRIIAITGSVGKTTTRKAVTMVVQERYETRKFEDNSCYNTEIGLPLFILGQKTPRYKILWSWVLIKCLSEIIFGRDLDVLVVEMGADKPGDIDYLTKLVKPDISIVTRVAASHLEEFKTVKNVLKEKEKIVKVLEKEDIAILNNDDALIKSMEDRTKARVITYGLGEDCDIYSSDIKISKDGTNFNLHLKGSEMSMHVKIIAKHLLYPVMAAAAVGISLDFPEEDIKKALIDFDSVKGRLRLIKGINSSTLIDDSYNSNPVSASNALLTLGNIAEGRKIAVLGTMNEMGDYFEEAHKEVGEKAVKEADILVAVGEGGKIIARYAEKRGFSKKNIYLYDNSEKAGLFLIKFIEKGDTVLIKGSQNKVRLERAVKMVMRDSNLAKKLLVRQSNIWGNR